MNKGKEFSHNVVGIGWVDDVPRVAISITGSWTSYLSVSAARHFAMQILMTANEIAQQEIEEEVE